MIKSIGDICCRVCLTGLAVLLLMLVPGSASIASDETDFLSNLAGGPYDAVFGSRPKATPETPQPQVARDNDAPQPQQTPEPPGPKYPPSRMFGAQLFNGSFKNLRGSGFNPDYQIALGDRLRVRMWGGFNFDGDLKVDQQGNIFLPNIGPVAVAGVPNSELNTVLEREMRRVFKSNVSLYASLDTSQPVKVFVTGFVRQPGLYAGNAAESPISYLDRAGGVDPDRGSYVDVVVRRGEQIRKRLNLYNFLLEGQLDIVQMQDGDVIVVGPRRYTFSVSGEVFNANDFEFGQKEIPLDRALAMAKPKPGATHVSVIRKQGAARRTEYYPLGRIGNVLLQDGDALSVTSDRYAGTIQVRVEGAHSGEHAVVMPYGATMKDIIPQIKPNTMSQMDAIQLFRKSVAIRQKEMLELSLNKLEEAAYSARSETIEEANLRSKEAELISKFVARARSLEPKGQVVLNEAALDATILEDGDIIQIPEKTSLVMVHGEVLLPNAVSWRSGLSARDYIDQVGGFSQSADSSKVIILRRNGEAVAGSSGSDLMPGDEIMVLPKIDTKNIEIVRGITQILYQAAIATRVMLLI